MGRVATICEIEPSLTDASSFDPESSFTRSTPNPAGGIVRPDGAEGKSVPRVDVSFEGGRSWRRVRWGVRDETRSAEQPIPSTASDVIRTTRFRPRSPRWNPITQASLLRGLPPETHRAPGQWPGPPFSHSRRLTVSTDPAGESQSCYRPRDPRPRARLAAVRSVRDGASAVSACRGFDVREERPDRLGVDRLDEVVVESRLLRLPPVLLLPPARHRHDGRRRELGALA